MLKQAEEKMTSMELHLISKIILSQEKAKLFMIWIIIIAALEPKPRL